MRRFLHIAAVVVTLATSAFAASGVRGPVQGYLVDSRLAAVRALNGIPGASVLSEPLALGRKISSGAFHTESGLGIVLTEGRVAVARGLDSQPTLEILENAIEQADLAVIDRSGKTGVVVSKAKGQLQYIGGLNGSAEALAPIALGEIAARIRALAVDSKRAVLAVGDPEGGVYQVNRNGSVELIARAADVTALALFADESGLAFADRASKQVMRTFGIHLGAATAPLATERDGVLEPVGLSVVGRRAYLADAGSQNILAIDLDSNLLDKGIELAAVPSRALAMDGGNTVVLTEVGDSPLYILDTTAAPRVFFVPAPAEQQ